MRSEAPTNEMVKRWESELDRRGWKREMAKGDYSLGAKIAATLETNPNLGLVLSGKYGAGKTAFVRAILPRARFFQLPMAEGVFDPNYELPQGDVILDDVGAEHSHSEWGVKMERFADFIVKFHARPTGRLVITTNLSVEEFEARYGGRVVSRLKDLCVASRLTGGDKREWTIIR